ncbi:hypothetical protein LH991_08965 [Schleiferilactobacillus harbinensis]|nr:hypothetical protein LH991_08965 [Schleiferilactobacillus harbinensis]
MGYTELEVVTLKSQEYAFPDKSVLVNHVYSRLDNPTLVKVQKSLYLLWAYYSATYGTLYPCGDVDIEYPKALFKPDFRAWRYGPVDETVYAEQKSESFSKETAKEYIPSKPWDTEVISFVNDLLKDTNKVNDFGLVARTHQDKSWSSVYKEGERYIAIDPKEIKSEYINKIKEASVV